MAYPSTGVVLTAENPFTLTPTALAPKENVAATARWWPTLATPTTIRASIRRLSTMGTGAGPSGDGHTYRGHRRHRTGPTHTYTTPGTYTVTTSVMNTNGTT